MDDLILDKIKLTPQWSLATDEQLIKYLENFSTHMNNKLKDISNNLYSLNLLSKVTKINLNNVFNDFESASNNQFIENRVYEDQVFIKKISSPEIVNKRSNEEHEATLIPKLQMAIANGVRILQDLPIQKATINKLSHCIIGSPDFYLLKTKNVNKDSSDSVMLQNNLPNNFDKVSIASSNLEDHSSISHEFNFTTVLNTDANSNKIKTSTSRDNVSVKKEESDDDDDMFAPVMQIKNAPLIENLKTPSIKSGLSFAKDIDDEEDLFTDTRLKFNTSQKSPSILSAEGNNDNSLIQEIIKSQQQRNLITDTTSTSTIKADAIYNSKHNNTINIEPVKVFPTSIFDDDDDDDEEDFFTLLAKKSDKTMKPISNESKNDTKNVSKFNDISKNNHINIKIENNIKTSEKIMKSPKKDKIFDIFLEDGKNDDTDDDIFNLLLNSPKKSKNKENNLNNMQKNLENENPSYNDEKIFINAHIQQSPQDVSNNILKDHKPINIHQNSENIFEQKDMKNKIPQLINNCNEKKINKKSIRDIFADLNDDSDDDLFNSQIVKPSIPIKTKDIFDNDEEELFASNKPLFSISKKDNSIIPIVAEKNISINHNFNEIDDKKNLLSISKTEYHIVEPCSSSENRAKPSRTEFQNKEDLLTYTTDISTQNANTLTSTNLNSLIEENKASSPIKKLSKEVMEKIVIDFQVDKDLFKSGITKSKIESAIHDKNVDRTMDLNGEIIDKSKSNENSPKLNRNSNYNLVKDETAVINTDDVIPSVNNSPKITLLNGIDDDFGTICENHSLLNSYIKSRPRQIGKRPPNQFQRTDLNHNNIASNSSNDNSELFSSISNFFNNTGNMINDSKMNNNIGDTFQPPNNFDKDIDVDFLKVNTIFNYEEKDDKHTKGNQLKYKSINDIFNTTPPAINIQSDDDNALDLFDKVFIPKSVNNSDIKINTALKDTIDFNLVKNCEIDNVFDNQNKSNSIDVNNFMPANILKINLNKSVEDIIINNKPDPSNKDISQMSKSLFDFMSDDDEDDLFNIASKSNNHTLQTKLNINFVDDADDIDIFKTDARNFNTIKILNSVDTIENFKNLSNSDHASDIKNNFIKQDKAQLSKIIDDDDEDIFAVNTSTKNIQSRLDNLNIINKFNPSNAEIKFPKKDNLDDSKKYINHEPHSNHVELPYDNIRSEKINNFKDKSTKNLFDSFSDDSDFDLFKAMPVSNPKKGQILSDKEEKKKNNQPSSLFDDPLNVI